MTYRNGKCYDKNGNEMTQSQINMMYRSSIKYIEEQNQKLESAKIPTTEDLINKLSEKFKVIKK